ncbi:hypothetical protein KXR56_10040 [Bacillus inaquosorum]|uniref:hypothetical protein n=1 Tax=Bacillus inaquosorum TaxID=483913 RepID=UPI003F172258
MNKEKKVKEKQKDTYTIISFEQLENDAPYEIPNKPLKNLNLYEVLFIFQFLLKPCSLIEKKKRSCCVANQHLLPTSGC